MQFTFLSKLSPAYSNQQRLLAAVFQCFLSLSLPTSSVSIPPSSSNRSKAIRTLTYPFPCVIFHNILLLNCQGFPLHMVMRLHVKVGFSSQESFLYTRSLGFCLLTQRMWVTCACGGPLEYRWTIKPQFTTWKSTRFVFHLDSPVSVSLLVSLPILSPVPRLQDSSSEWTPQSGAQDTASCMKFVLLQTRQILTRTLSISFSCTQRGPENV